MSIIAVESNTPTQQSLFKDFIEEVRRECRQSKPVEPVYTYQQLMDRYHVGYTVIRQWFSKREGILKRTKRTVRIPESVVLAFDEETRTGKKDATRTKKRAK